MQERTRARTRRGGPAPNDIFDADPEEPRTVTVTHGPFAEELPVAGLSVGAVRTRFRDRLDIDPEATALVDGSPATDDVVVQPGQLLMFVRRAGEKGVPCRVS